MTAIEPLPIEYGCRGTKLTFSVPMLYKTYRVGTVIKLYPSGHTVPVLTIEERMPKDFDTFLRPKRVVGLSWAARAIPQTSTGISVR